MNAWLPGRAIYLQVQDQIVDRVLAGDLGEGAPVPSVREAAAALGVNPLTVNRACQELVDAGVLEKRRGVGLFVAGGARQALRGRLRERFLRQEWPALVARTRMLGLALSVSPLPSEDASHA